MDNFGSLIRDLSPLFILAAGVALVLHGHTDSGLITGAFALIQVGPRPTKPSAPVAS